MGDVLSMPGSVHSVGITKAKQRQGKAYLPSPPSSLWHTASKLAAQFVRGSLSQTSYHLPRLLSYQRKVSLSSCLGG